MNQAFANSRTAADELAWPSLDASDEFEWPRAAPYCPVRLLGAFALLMAGHGTCINTSMMLGDREYAMRQLARAHTMADAQLREVSARLFAYFDARGAPVPAGLRA